MPAFLFYYLGQVNISFQRDEVILYAEMNVL